MPSTPLEAALSPGRPLVLLGGGKMGSAMLKGWFEAGLPGAAARVVDPAPNDALSALCAKTGAGLSDAPDATQAGALVVAVKPQTLDAALPSVAHLNGPDTLVVSVAAGAPIARFETTFGARTPIVRTMPNTPSAVGRGVTALIANAAATEAAKSLAETLLRAVGETVWLDAESQMDAVTGVSGSGPAYIFHMVEALAAAGEAEGLPAELALRLARATVSGAGALLEADPSPASTLRENVTSPAGTTYAGLQALMDPESGLTPLMTRTVAAAAARSRELGGSK